MSGLRSTCVGLLLIAPVCLAGCGPKAEKTVEATTTPRSVPVTVAPVESRAIERVVGAVGTLKGWDEVTVGAKKVGRVAKVLHDIGDKVKPGELLVEFETNDAVLALDQAKKQLLAELAKVGVILSEYPETIPGEKEIDVLKLPTVIQAQLAVDRAQQNLAREKNLMNKGAGMRQDLQNTENDLRNAQAAYENSILTRSRSSWQPTQPRFGPDDGRGAQRHGNSGTEAFQAARRDQGTAELRDLEEVGLAGTNDPRR